MLYVLILYSESCLLYSVLRNFSISQNSNPCQRKEIQAHAMLVTEAEKHLPMQAL